MSLSRLDVRSQLRSADSDLLILSSATNLPKIYKALGKLDIQTGAFQQLTRRYMSEEFNPNTPNREGVR